MIKLDKEQVHFIDDYLENSDVVHVDIRSEMVDHVASGIEEKMKSGDGRDFYYIFKDYMVDHKSRLLDNNKQFLRAADIKILKAIGKTILSWQSFVVFLITFLMLYILQYNYGVNTIKSWIIGLPLLGFIVFAISYFIGLKFLKLDRFSAVERIAFVCNAFFQIFHLIWIISKRKIESENFFFITIIIGLSITLLFAIVRVTQSMIKSYQTKFKSLA